MFSFQEKGSVAALQPYLVRYLLEATVLAGVIWDQALRDPYSASTRTEESTGLRKTLYSTRPLFSAEISVVDNQLKNQLRKLKGGGCVCNCLFGIQLPLRHLGYLVCAEEYPELSVCFPTALPLES